MSAARSASSPPAAGRAALVLAVVGVLAFAGFLASLAGAPDGGGDTRGANALSRSAVGYAGLVRLLGATGRDVRITRGSPPAQGLLVLTPGPGSTPAAVDRLVAGRTALVLFPKWSAPRDRRRAGGVLKAGLDKDGMSDVLNLAPAEPDRSLKAAEGVGRPVLRPAPDAARAGGASAVLAARFARPSPVGPIDTFFTFDQGRQIPLLVDGAGRAVLVRLPGRPVHLLSDADLFNNQGLASLDTARAAVAVVDALRAGGPVSFDVSLNGFGVRRNALALMVRPPFAAATACLVLAALLAGLHGLQRFGPPGREARAYGFGKLALVDSAASLLATARREPRLARPYAELVRAETARALGLDAASGPGAAELDRTAARRGATPWGALVDAARAVRTPAALMLYVRRLQDWRTEVTGGR